MTFKEIQTFRPDFWVFQIVWNEDVLAKVAQDRDELFMPQRRSSRLPFLRHQITSIRKIIETSSIGQDQNVKSLNVNFYPWKNENIRN